MYQDKDQTASVPSETNVSLQTDNDLEEMHQIEANKPPSSLTNRDIEIAIRTIETSKKADGQITKCREELLRVGTHPGVVSVCNLPPIEDPRMDREARLAALEPIEEPCEDPSADAGAEFQLLTLERGEDTNRDNDEIEDPEVEDEEEFNQNDDERSVEEEPVITNRSQQEVPDWEAALIKHMSTLYESLSSGINSVLKSNQEIKGLLMQQRSELKCLQAEQGKINAVIAGLGQQIQGLSTSINQTQGDMLDMKREMSVCAASFLKMNSALLQLNTGGFPQGKVPVLGDYRAATNPTNAAVHLGTKTTPTAYKTDQLMSILQKRGGFPADKIPILVTLLENRTPRSFSALLPTLQVAVSLSDEAVTKLLEMGHIENGKDLAIAIQYLHEIMKRQSGIQKVEKSAPPAQQSPSTSAPAYQTLHGTSRSQVKKSMNPFS